MIEKLSLLALALAIHLPSTALVGAQGANDDQSCPQSGAVKGQACLLAVSRSTSFVLADTRESQEQTELSSTLAVKKSDDEARKTDPNKPFSGNASGDGQQPEILPAVTSTNATGRETDDVVIVPIPVVMHSRLKDGHILPYWPRRKLRSVADWLMFAIEKFSYDLIVFFTTFMPNLKVPLHIQMLAFASLATAILWLMIYIQFIYENDRSTSLNRWGSKVHKVQRTMEKMRKASTPGHVHHADLTIVFSHPSIHNSETDNLSTANIRKLVHYEDDETFLQLFPRLHALCDGDHDANSLPTVGFIRSSTQETAVTGGETVDWHTSLPTVRFGRKGGGAKGQKGGSSASSSTFSMRPSEISNQVKKHLTTAIMLDSNLAGEAVPAGSGSLGHLSGHLRDMSALMSHGHVSARGHDLNISHASARTALLQDFCKCMQGLGFDVQNFTSYNGKKIYVCVSILHESAVVHYLDRDNIRVQLQKGIAAKVGVAQPVEDPESSPPYVTYDPRIQERLHAAGIIDKPSETQLYHMHNCGVGGASCLASSATRLFVIGREISQRLDLSYAKAQGLLLDFYPMHDRHRLQTLRVTWSDWSHLLNLGFVQPLHLIHDYFGSRVAFSFAWKGVYSKAIIALVPLSLLYELAMLVAPTMRTTMSGVAAGTGESGRVLLGFSLVLVTWGKVAQNLWKREEAFFAADWDLKAHYNDKIIRPRFRGEMAPSPVDLNQSERQVSAFSAMMKAALADSANLCCCALVAFIIWLQRRVFENSMSFLVSVLFTLQITFFAWVYDYVVEWLLVFENKKYQEDWYNSYLRKQFTFQSVNNYFPFVLLVMKQASLTVDLASDGNQWSGDGLHEVRKKLSLSLGILSASRVVEVAFGLVKVKWGSWNPWEAIRRRRPVGTNQEPSKVSFTEEQSGYQEFKSREQIWAMLYPVISLGHVLLFGVAAPIVAPLCLLVFVMARATTAFMLTNCARRPYPSTSHGLGAWDFAVFFLMRAGLLSTGCILVSFGELFRDTPLLTRSFGLLLFCLTALGLWAAVDLCFPSSDGSAELLVNRRRRVEIAVQQVGTRTGYTEQTLSSSQQLGRSSARDIANTEAVDRGDWKAILPAEGTTEADGSSSTSSKLPGLSVATTRAMEKNVEKNLNRASGLMYAVEQAPGAATLGVALSRGVNLNPF